MTSSLDEPRLTVYGHKSPHFSVRTLVTPFRKRSFLYDFLVYAHVLLQALMDTRLTPFPPMPTTPVPGPSRSGGTTSHDLPLYSLLTLTPLPPTPPPPPAPVPGSHPFHPCPRSRCPVRVGPASRRRPATLPYTRS